MNYEIWYKVGYGLHAAEVEVQKANNKSVWIVQRAYFDDQKDIFKAVKKHSHHESYYKTKEEAKQEIIRRASKQKKKAEEELKEAQEILDNGPKLFKLQPITPLPSSQRGKFLV